MGDNVEIEEYFTSYSKSLGRVTGYVLLSNNKFFHVRDAHIIDGVLVVDNLYGTEM